MANEQPPVPPVRGPHPPSPPGQTPIQPAGGKGTSHMKCPKCGQEYEVSLGFCTNCGEPNPGKEVDPVSPPVQPGKSKRKVSIPTGINLVISIVAVVLIIGLSATTVIFALQWSSAKNDVKEAEAAVVLAEKEASEAEDVAKEVEKVLGSLDELEEMAKSLFSNSMKSAEILIKDGYPTDAYWGLSKEIATQVGELTATVMLANGRSEEDIDAFVYSVTGRHIYE